jgi:hypothetical protein
MRLRKRRFSLKLMGKGKRKGEEDDEGSGIYK